jgi:hypothetical protein
MQQFIILTYIEAILYHIVVPRPWSRYRLLWIMGRLSRQYIYHSRYQARPVLAEQLETNILIHSYRVLYRQIYILSRPVKYIIGVKNSTV